ncbi:MAG: tRNA pseudouridine(54/55) synthase Pus10 [Candidatus Micrarchaeota archaeon]
MYTLCSECNKANGGSFKEGQCHICEGGMPSTGTLLEKAEGLLKGRKFTSFSISTTIPKDWMIREEDIWDCGMRDGQSIKNYMNRALSALVEKSTGLSYQPEADCRISFDLRSGNVFLERSDLNIFGRYEKLVAGISQSRWTCKLCNGKGCKRCGGKGKNYESIEEKIGEPAKSECMASSYSLHASGREDVDALNSAGRPFVLSVKNPENMRPDLVRLAEEIGKGKEIIVRSLAIVPRGYVELVTESHFNKEYEAEIEFRRDIGKEDVEKIVTLEGEMLRQRTPKRVAHRRADLVRNRRILSISVLKHSGNTAMIRIKAEAGTYIKELISGDEGRSEPSISALLQTEAKCTSLTVSGIDDEFLGLFGL